MKGEAGVEESFIGDPEIGKKEWSDGGAGKKDKGEGGRGGGREF